ncbi:MAG: RluA family pseudouridine synthase [Verrucomicrobia bacterium]|nr:RluA family pseudouridine synthase [Verrucomicrobiota bacterium]
MPVASETFEVNAADSKQRLDLYATRKLASLSRSRIKDLIADGHILLNERISKPAQTVRTGDIVRYIERPLTQVYLAPEDIRIGVLYEDDDLIVVDKPAGMIVHPGAGIDRGTVVNALLHSCANLSGIGGELRPGIIHRLDKETSGCLVVAKRDLAHKRLSAQFSSRKVRKYYLAFCIGHFVQQSGSIEAPIGRHPIDRKKMSVSIHGRTALTKFWVLKKLERRSLLLCRIFTGRTHQIRVHLKSIGHPIVGDKVYGKSPDHYPRHLLHAWRIGFFHPQTEKWLEFEAQIPHDFRHEGSDDDAIFRARCELGH